MSASTSVVPPQLMYQPKLSSSRKARGSICGHYAGGKPSHKSSHHLVALIAPIRAFNEPTDQMLLQPTAYTTANPSAAEVVKQCNTQYALTLTYIRRVLSR